MTCSICLEEIKEDDFILEDCEHNFHVKCIMKWFRQGNKTCPICFEGWMYKSKLAECNIIKKEDTSSKNKTIIDINNNNSHDNSSNWDDSSNW